MFAKMAMKKVAKKQAKKQVQKQVKKKVQQKVEAKIKEKAQDKIQERVQEKVDAKTKTPKKKKKKKKFGGVVKMDRFKEEFGLEDVDMKEMVMDQVKGGVPGVKLGLGGRGSKGDGDLEDEPRRRRGCRYLLCGICHCISGFYRWLGRYLPCCRAGTFANQLTKNAASFLCGALFLVLFYAIFVLALKQEPRRAAMTVMVLGPVVCFGMAFSRRFRCVMLLMMPQLFSGKGRTILMAYGFLLVLSGPVENMSYNMDVAGQSQVCGSELAMNQSYKMFQVATAPMASFADQVSSLIDKLRAIGDRIKEGFKALKDAVDALGQAIQDFFDWIGDMVDKCNEKLGIPEKRCRQAFEHAAYICRRDASFLGFVCGIVDLVSHVCLLAALVKLLCFFPMLIKFGLNTARDAFNDAVEKLNDQFYVDFEFTHDFRMDYNFSRTAQQIRDSILGEMEQRTETFLLVVTWLNRLVSFTFLLLLFKAYKYYHCYRVKDKYDNWYITDFFNKLDERREEAGKETLLPLTRKERRIYVTPDSIYLAKPEKRRFIMGFVMWITQVGYAGMLMVADCTAYWFLDLVRMHSELNVHINAPGAVTLDVQGGGLLADIYRALVESLDPRHISNFEADTSACLPHPSLPDTGTYRVIGIIFGICLFLIVFESYGLRLRRAIMSRHYPERERVRAVWLYNQILRRRGGFKKFLLKNKKQKAQDRSDYGLISHLASRSKIWAKLLKLCGFQWKFCTNCGVPGKAKDTEGFVHCANTGCVGVYCLECVNEIHNMCQMCSRPVDYSVNTDVFDFERASSDEDKTSKRRSRGGKDEENLLSDSNSEVEDLDYSYQYKSAHRVCEEDEEDDEDDEEEEEEEESKENQEQKTDKPHWSVGIGGGMQPSFRKGMGKRKVSKEEDEEEDEEDEDEEEEDEEEEEGEDQQEQAKNKPRLFGRWMKTKRQAEDEEDEEDEDEDEEDDEGEDNSVPLLFGAIGGEMQSRFMKGKREAEATVEGDESNVPLLFGGVRDELQSKFMKR